MPSKGGRSFLYTVFGAKVALVRVLEIQMYMYIVHEHIIQYMGSKCVLVAPLLGNQESARRCADIHVYTILCERSIL